MKGVIAIVFGITTLLLLVYLRVSAVCVIDTFALGYTDGANMVDIEAVSRMCTRAGSLERLLGDVKL